MMSNIIISSISASGSTLFYISSGITSGVSYRWYLNNNLVSLNSTYLLPTGITSGEVFVDVDHPSDSIWYNGQFYGGTFSGNFIGGQFYYGYLNGVYYPYQNIKPKVFMS